ncbi:MAG: ATP-dependent helicase [Sedimentisphaerales bacterium]|nr:ATP-dependent helicase [Sedimentisphaerales bacterium]
MELTQEQYDIIHSTGNIKINAVAGSGKTTTIIEYAKARPSESKILYLAFNKSVKLEAVKKFSDKGLKNVEVETAHSLAYKHIVPKFKYKIRPQGYKTYEIAELLGLHADGEKHAEYIVANHINNFIAYFCNSDKLKVHDLNYLDVVVDNKAREFVSKYYRYIETQTRLLLKKMDDGEIEITHDFYLKKFQLSNPKLNFDYILFDEGQDASPAMLNIFLKQRATKVIVGDTHQQIYGWRYAVNSLEKTDFKTFQLSLSFRFSQDIARLAVEIVSWKNHLTDVPTISIIGKGNSKAHKVKAVLARTNLGLLLKSIEYLQERENIQHIYFEGNINSYTYADDGASLYDVLNLYNGKHSQIRDKLIMAMKDLYELEEYIDKTDDVQLGMMVEIVKEYGNEIPGIIKRIKNKHVENNEREKADIVFSTVHRSKGMEYDTVQLVNDFITEEKIKKIKEEKAAWDLNKVNEEINLLYVAVTRTKNSIFIPETLIPYGLPSSAQIYITKVEAQGRKIEPENIRKSDDLWAGAIAKNDKAKIIDEARKTNKDAYLPWTTELDDELTVMYCEGASVKDLSKYFGRSDGAIRSRIKKLELRELYGLIRF